MLFQTTEKVKRVNELCNILHKKYPFGEFMCTPMYSYSGESVYCVVCLNYKSDIFHFEYNPIDELLTFLEKINNGEKI